MAGLEANTLADGLFHASTWFLARSASGCSGGRQRTHDHIALAGAGGRGCSSGWGLFNVVEGLVDHHLLGIHHVREGAHQTAWDLGFLAFGLALLAAGWLLTRSAAQEPEGGRVIELGHARPDGHARRSS